MQDPYRDKAATEAAYWKDRALKVEDEFHVHMIRHLVEGRIARVAFYVCAPIVVYLSGAAILAFPHVESLELWHPFWFAWVASASLAGWATATLSEEP
jgi:hypothetical protein